MTGKVHAAAVPKRSAPLALALSLGVALAYLGLRDAPTASAIESQTLQWRFALRGSALPPPQRVAVAAIDERTMTALRQRWPLQRRDLAAIIDRLGAEGAAAIGVDLQFAETEQQANGTPSPGDQALAESLRRSDRSVLALAFTYERNAAPSESAQAFAADAAFRVVANAARVTPDHTLQMNNMLTPIDVLRGTAAMGHVNMLDDNDGVLRTMPAALVFADRYVPAFPVILAARHNRVDPSSVALMVDGGLRLGPPGSAPDIALEPGLLLPINYYGRTQTVPTYSVIELLEGRIPAGEIEGRTFLIGATAVALGDQFVTPFGRMPGVEVLATLTANLIDGRLLERAALRDWNVAAIMLLGLVTFALARLVKPGAVIGVALTLVIGWFAVAQLAFNHGLWLDVTFPSAAILLSAGCVAALRAMIERRMRRNLARYHSPNIVDLLAEQATPSFEGRAQNAAIMFVDIAGFTTRAEGMSPADTVPLLRAFHARVERAVLAHGGVLERFMGDGALIIFGVPDPTTHDASAALACARALIEDVRCWNIDLAAEGQKPLDVSAGVHYGPVVMARLGGETQAEMTAAGDTVNVASRIEKMTREHDATIAISDAVVAALDEPERAALLAGFAQVPTQEVRGRVGKIVIWVKPRDRAAAA